MPAFRALPEEFAALGIRIARHPQVRQHDMVGQCQIVITQRLTLLCDPDQAAGRR